MNLEEIKKQVIGPIATVGTPFDDDFEVDYGKFHNLTQWWVEQGLVKGRAVIKVAAAMGEGPQLRDIEWPVLLRTAVQAADDKAASMQLLETGEPAIDIENSADQEPLQTSHADAEVAALPLPDVQTAEDDIPKVAAPAGE